MAYLGIIADKKPAFTTTPDISVAKATWNKFDTNSTVTAVITMGPRIVATIGGLIADVIKYPFNLTFSNTKAFIMRKRIDHLNSERWPVKVGDHLSKHWVKYTVGAVAIASIGFTGYYYYEPISGFATRTVADPIKGLYNSYFNATPTPGAIPTPAATPAPASAAKPAPAPAATPDAQ